MNSTPNLNSRKRIEKDVMKLIMSEYEVKLKNESKLEEFSVSFKGPKDSPYEEGTWTIDVLLPDSYPYKSPSIGFSNKIYHPNIDEASGSVCLDVINQTWSPMYELKNIFDVFLPQLLSYPNPSDPLNSQAAKLLLNDSKKYEATVKDYVKKYALKEEIKKNVNEIAASNSNVRKYSSFSNKKEEVKIVKNKVSVKKTEEDDDNLDDKANNTNNINNNINNDLQEEDEDDLSVLSAASIDNELEDDDDLKLSEIKDDKEETAF